MDAHRRLLAWHACHVMAPHLKKRDRPSPTALLGESAAPKKAKRKKRRRKKRKRNLEEGA